MNKLLVLFLGLFGLFHESKTIHRYDLDIFISYLIQHLDQHSTVTEGFTKNTQILGPDGYVTIQKITPNTQLKSIDSNLQVIIQQEQSHVSHVYTITLSNGHVISAAPSQQLFEQRSYSFKKASKLCTGDQLSNHTIINVTKQHGYFTIYKITTSDHMFLLNGDLIVHNANVADIAGLTIQIGSCCLTHPVVAAISRSISLIKYAWYLHNLYTDMQQRATNIQQIMQDQEIILATREYFQTKHQQLTDLLRQYTQLQQAVIALCNQSAINTALLMFPATTNQTTVQLIPLIAVELSYNPAQRQQLLEIRQKTLIELEQKITSIQIAVMLQLQDQYDRLNARLIEFAPLLQNTKNMSIQQVPYHDRFRASQIMHNMLYRYIAAKESLDSIVASCNTLSLLCQFYQHPQNAIILKQSTNLLDVCSEITQKITEINQYKPNTYSYLQQMIDATQHQALRSGLVLQQDINNIVLRLQNDRQKKNQQENNNALAKKSTIQFPTPPDDPDEEDYNKKQFNIDDYQHEKNEICENMNDIVHMFRDKSGKLKDNTETRQQIVNLVRDKRNCYGQDRHGVVWYAKRESDGTQLWAEVNPTTYRVRNCGINSTDNIRTWNPLTGFKQLPKK
ncbi:hypothetical protein KBD08_01385 [Candidatus Babeliales bacterium]|nr:hypothetical protein [Candidatus Babeliales bacterium]